MSDDPYKDYTDPYDYDNAPVPWLGIGIFAAAVVICVAGLMWTWMT